MLFNASRSLIVPKIRISKPPFMAFTNTLDGKRRIALISAISLAFLLLWSYQVLLRNFSTKIPSSWRTEASIQPTEPTDAVADLAIIPNIVHFVHLVSAEHPFVDFAFRQFIAVYSAWHYLQPDIIYIHTNMEEALINETLSNSTNSYTQAIFKLPGIVFSYHSAPNQTRSGKEINLLPNQSDFVRTEVLQRLGGIYLDDDAYILRDLKPLYRLGFQNILGRQINGEICPAVMMSTPHNNLMTAYHALQDSTFDGSWARHATGLLTDLVREFQFPAYQVLILPYETLFPLSWLPDDVKYIYQVHEGEDDPSPAIDEKPSQNVTDFIDHFTMDKPASWRQDWRLSYVLHGWNKAVERLAEEEHEAQLFGSSQGITLEYVLAGNSNFARAVLPAVKHAVDSGVLAQDKMTPELRSP